MARITQAIAAGVGQYSAMTDISSYVDLELGITRSWGRQSEFDDIRAGEFSFVLDNIDGRFTPGNTTVPAPMREGTRVCWQAGPRLVAGTVLRVEPFFPQDESAWAKVRVVCEDMLGPAARAILQGDTLAHAMVLGSPAYIYWPFDDGAGSTAAAEKSGNGQLALEQYVAPNVNNHPPEFGVAGTARAGGTQARLTSTPGDGVQQFAPMPIPLVNGANFKGNYEDGSWGAWGFWFTPQSANAGFKLEWTPQPGSQFSCSFECAAISAGMKFTINSGTSPSVSSPALALNTARYFAVQFSIAASGLLTADVFMDGALLGSATSSGALLSPDLPRRIKDVVLTVGHASLDTEVLIQHLSHTKARVNQFRLQPGSASLERWFQILGEMSADVTLSVASGLSTAPITYPEWQDQVLLDLLNEAIRTEGGYLYPQTSGTLLAPVQALRVAPRIRKVSIAETFNAENEAQGEPELVRDLTNMVAAIEVTGGSGVKAIARDSDLALRVGAAQGTDSVLLTAYEDVLAWAQDRIVRGANTALSVRSITIDAMTTPTDRSAALLGLTPGDRVRITGLPSSQLGFSTWEGWFLGADETHSLEAHTFQLYFTPVLPAISMYDEAEFASDGNLWLTTGFLAGATSIQISRTTGSALIDNASLPHTIRIDNEQMTITAINTANPQVATVTRGVNGTTAAGHRLGAEVEIEPPGIYAF